MIAEELQTAVPTDPFEGVVREARAKHIAQLKDTADTLLTITADYVNDPEAMSAEDTANTLALLADGLSGVIRLLDATEHRNES